jgi:plasmid stability protein
MTTPLQIRNLPGDVLDVLRERAAKRQLSLAAYAREVLIREAARATMEQTLKGRRVIGGRRLTAGQLGRLMRAGRA